MKSWCGWRFTNWGRNHLLKETLVLPPKLPVPTRRGVMRALGLTAAVAIPVVASIVAPMPAQAATCFWSWGGMRLLGSVCVVFL